LKNARPVFRPVCWAANMGKDYRLHNLQFNKFLKRKCLRALSK
jgi:hypothetical protein